MADNPAAPGTYSVGYQYHSGGAVSALRYPSGLTLYYRKNARGQITQIDVQEPGKNQPILPWLTELRYTALGQPSAWRWNCLRGAGTAATALPCDSAQRSFDADGRMLSTEFSRYGYDSASRITQLGQTLHSSAGAVPMNWTVAYDSRDRITQFSRAGASSAYSYDANSNRLGSVSTTVGDTNLDGAFDQGDWSQSSVQSRSVDSNYSNVSAFAARPMQPGWMQGLMCSIASSMFYNPKRRHNTASSVSPVEFEKCYFQRLGCV